MLAMYSHGKSLPMPLVIAPPPPAFIQSAASANPTTPRHDAPGPLAVIAAVAGEGAEPAAADGASSGHGTFSLQGARDVTLHVQRWEAQPTRRGVLVISHGLNSHSGRYTDLARELTQRGWTVYAHDHRGHGKSGGSKVDVERFDDFVQDLQTVIDTVRRREPGLPLVLYGHSMGGQVAARFAIEQKPMLAGLVLVAPAMAEPEGADAFKAGAARFLTWMGAGSLRVFELSTDGFSRDPAVTASLEADPLIYGNGTARLATEIIASIRTSNARAAELELPVLALHGDVDTITPAAATEAFVRQVGRADAVFKSLPGYVHDPLFDADAGMPRQLVYEQIDRWITEGARAP